jgi:hypothetical protein
MEAMELPMFSTWVHALSASRRAEVRLELELAMANRSRTSTRRRRMVQRFMNICESLARKPRYGVRYDVWFIAGRDESCWA